MNYYASTYRLRILGNDLRIKMLEIEDTVFSLCRLPHLVMVEIS